MDQNQNKQLFSRPYELALVDDSRRNKKLSSRLLVRCEAAFLELMNKYGDDYIPTELRELTSAAHITRQTFYGNFMGINSLLYWSSKHLIDGLDEYLSAKPLHNSLDTALFWTFKYHTISPAESEFCIRRFGDANFWATALEPIAPLLKEPWQLYGDQVATGLYRFFCAQFQEVLLLWLDDDLSITRVNTYIALLISLNKTAAPRLFQYFRTTATTTPSSTLEV